MYDVWILGTVIKYSEIFKSIQGEGKYSGVTSIWLRFFTCNLNCDGFGQKDPTDPSTYVLSYKEFDVKSIKNIEELPVWNYGCDSSYSWSAKFKHLQYNETAEQICDRFEALLKTDKNSEGKFDNVMNPIHLCFTGGEPLLPKNQRAVLEILKELDRRENRPFMITFETNGTQELTTEFRQYFELHHFDEVFYSVSPKLFTTSGEERSRAIKPDVIADYISEQNAFGQLKFVVDGSQRSWDELEEVIDIIRQTPSFDFCPVYIMKAGATKEGQTGELANYISEAEVCDEAMRRGYYYTTRAHVHIYGNKLGT